MTTNMGPNNVSKSMVIVINFTIIIGLRVLDKKRGGRKGGREWKKERTLRERIYRGL